MHVYAFICMTLDATVLFARQKEEIETGKEMQEIWRDGDPNAVIRHHISLLKHSIPFNVYGFQIT